VKRITQVKTIFIVAIFFGLVSSCQSVKVDALHPGWENITLYATGFGQIEKDWSISERIRAVQKAKMDVYAKLESDIMKLQTDSKKKVSDLVADDEGLYKKIGAFVRGAKIIRTENNEKGVKVVAEIFLGGNFKATIGLGAKKLQGSPSSVPQRGGNSPR